MSYASRGMEAVAADFVATVSGGVLAPGWVGIEGGRIAEVREGRPPRELDVFDGGPDTILVPGLVSAHTHLALGGWSGVGEDRTFIDWILRGIVPAIEAASRHPGSFLEGARRSARELLAGGVTLVGDNFLRAEGVTALRETGQRGIFFQEVFGSLAADEDAYWIETARELDRLPAILDGFPFGYSPHTPWTCPPKVMSALAARARAEGRGLSLHLDESVEEHSFFTEGSGPLRDLVAKRGTLARYRTGATPTRMLADAGVLGRDVVAAHAVQVTEDDIGILAREGVSVAHCPTTNLKLAEGIAPVAAMLEAGVNVALGVDSEASSGRLDLFEEMRRAMLLQRGARRSIGGLTAARALEMATLAGARALGLEKHTGSVERGKAADLALVRLRPALPVAPRDPVAALVWSATPADVELVLVDGIVRWRSPRG